MFFISAFCCCLEVTINVSTLEIQKNSELEFWMLVLHGLFGIGGLVGPIIVYFFELRSFMVMGVLIVIIAPFYCILQTPEDHKKIEEQMAK
jgi:fucose permease